ncbi:MAG: TPM domain-containing protein [Anaeromyxobacter sp.]
MRSLGTLAAAGALALAALAAGPALAEVAVPALTGPVVDRARVLSSADVARLENLARAGKASGGGAGPQLQYLVVPTTGGEAIEAFSMRVAEAWKLGTRDRDDGVLVVVAVQDRAVRIEVGGGIEGALTDAQSSRIIRNAIVPAFREGRYGDGLFDAGHQILSALGASTQDLPAPRRSQPRSSGQFPLAAFLAFIVLTSVLRGVFGFGRRRRRFWWGGGGPWIGGGGFGGFGGGGGGGGWSGGGGGFSGGGASGRW